MRTLDELRVEIDRIDQQMVQLFEERMQVVAEVMAVKKAAGIPHPGLLSRGGRCGEEHRPAHRPGTGRLLRADDPADDGPLPGIPGQFDGAMILQSARFRFHKTEKFQQQPLRDAGCRMQDFCIAAPEFPAPHQGHKKGPGKFGSLFIAPRGVRGIGQNHALCTNRPSPP